MKLYTLTNMEEQTKHLQASPTQESFDLEATTIQ